MAIADINSIYDNLLKSRLASAKKNRETQILNLENQRGGIDADYQGILDQIRKVKGDVENRYKGLYTGLDNEKKQGDEQFYRDRNAVDVGVNQNLIRTREALAANNLLGGGANLQAQLNMSTDRMNGLGTVATNQAKYNQTLADRRAQYMMEEQSSYNDLENQRLDAERNKAQKLQELMNQINLINSQGMSDDEAIKAEIEAQRIRDILAYQEQARAAAARSSGGSSRSSSGSSSKKTSQSSVRQQAYEALDYYMKQGQGDEFLRKNAQELKKDLGTQEYYRLLKEKQMRERELRGMM